jgi:Holliday junction resolvase
MNSKQKGKRGELELAKKLREFGYEARRGQQYSGIEGEDVVGLKGIHIECKRVERLNIYDAIAQAKRDRKAGQKPAVFHRKNNCQWLVTMELEDWIEIYREWEMTQTAALNEKIMNITKKHIGDE